MPVFSKETAKTDSSDGEGDPCGPYRALLFSDSGGLTQFGAFEEILPPGSSSSVKHWHAGEDEMVYVLEGEVTLHEGDDSVVMRPGDAATFKAGDPVGHCMQNNSDTEVRYLVIGTRSPRDVVTYPDHNRILHLDRESGNRRWTDHAGSSADTPYQTD
ncbi:cupin domain-containing protein [Tritonibacter mobilis]|uniref:cupin domain-containing protein n=1 Tax=Tritonibacter mobilis TaxID=379347 RepID=UPI001C09D830|nr:cupin domain-containing protein [Tritonibacter mobilis]MBU3035088.1 cupin domain-containing protein [Tritonibacter mobilis]WHQ83554.1 cupin domain-containing protein [Tritonibacter mobilis]